MLGQSGHARLLIAALLLSAGVPAIGQTVGILTVAEGRIELVRGAATYSAAQGVQLQNGDMLATEPKGQAQIEFDDGTILNLSRGSRAFLLGPQSPSGEAGVALVGGWAKFARTKGAKGKSYRYVMPLARLSAAGATGVLRIAEDASEIFVESGSARFVEQSKGGVTAGGRDMKAGEFLVRRAGQSVTVSSRPSPDFIKSMPGYFRDDLPVLIARAKSRKAEPTREHETTYAEVEPWLKASTPIRRPLVSRFQGRAKDSQFRSKLIENLAQHPEWDRTLFPEKYEKEEAEKAEKAEKAR
jgi:hypothetical protein